MASLLHRLARAGALVSLSVPSVPSLPPQLVLLPLLVLPTFWPGVAGAQVPAQVPAQVSGDPKRECLAASERGQNERDEGKFRAARQSFASCTHDICPRLVVDLCTKWVHELDQVAPTIVLSAKDEQGNDLSDVKVMFDAAPFATVLDGKPIEADAGTHFLRFERDGSAPVDRTVNIRAGERARLINVVLGPATGIPEGGPNSVPSNDLPPPDVPPTVSARRSSPARYVTSGALGLAALGAVGTGIYFLTQSNNNADEAATLRSRLVAMNSCANPPQPVVCQTLADKVHSQHDEMAVAMTLFVGGGLLAAGALATFFLWPAAGTRSAQTSAWLVPTQAGFTIQVARRFP